MQDSKYLTFEKKYCLGKAQIPTKSAAKIIGELKKETTQKSCNSHSFPLWLRFYWKT